MVDWLMIVLKNYHIIYFLTRPPIKKQAKDLPGPALKTN